ncbi:MAG TPA: hypothetical protein ENJ09_10505 [Planctomycetes bacterium]|nr:hypothetical protein [Planctomycetota bacterium]
MSASEGSPRSHAPARVRKRDGRVVEFQVDKITAAIAAAMEAVGEPDPDFAAEVAGVVALSLGDRIRSERGDTARLPDIEEIQDLVEHALMELGRPAVAKAYILYRDRRARIREALRVHRSDRVGRSARSVRVHEDEGVSPWSKHRLVSALVDEAELSREAAEEIASAVERRVFASGQTRITTALVRELVTGELLERGWTRALSSSGLVGLGRQDLGAALAGRPLAAWERDASNSLLATGAPSRGSVPEARLCVGSEVLRRFALEDLLSGGPGELHRTGELHVEDLGAPHLPLVLSAEAELFASGGHSVSSAQAVLEGVADLTTRVSRAIVLERPDRVLAPLLRAARPGSPLGLTGWLRALCAISRASGVRIDFSNLGPRSTAFTARLVSALAELPPGPFLPGLFFDGHGIEALLAENQGLAAAVDRLMGEGRLVTSWGEEDEEFVAPGCRRRRREPGILACGGAIALNLPRLARRAGPWREELVQNGIVELVQAALEIASDLDRFQAGLDRARPSGFHSRRGWAIQPVGLAEALSILGEGELDTDLGARILGLISEAASRFSSGLEHSVVAVSPCSFFGERAARRFAWLDRARRREEAGEQRWLFQEGEETEAPPLRPYTPGFALSPVAGELPGRAEAQCLRTLVSGALPLSGLQGPARRAGLHSTEEPMPHLAAWRRFEVLRRARSGEVVLELFPTRRAPSGPHSLRPLT